MSPSASCAKSVMPTRTGPAVAGADPLVLGGVPQVLRVFTRGTYPLVAPGVG